MEDFDRSLIKSIAKEVSLLPDGEQIQSALPSDRPLTGEDLSNWRRFKQLSSSDMCWLLGTPSSKWGEMTNKNKTSVVNPDVEILMRVWDTYPATIPLPPKITATELRETMDIQMRELGLLLGKEDIAGHRWIKHESGDSSNGQNQTPLTKRLSLAAFVLNQANLTNKYLSIVNRVSSLRGIGNILEAGTWKTAEERTHLRMKRLYNATSKKLANAESIDAETTANHKSIIELSARWIALSESIPGRNKEITLLSAKCNLLLKKSAPADVHERELAKLTKLNKQMIDDKSEMSSLQMKIKHLG
jgi:hypothetical protein